MGHSADAEGDRGSDIGVHGGRGGGESDSVGSDAARLDCDLLQAGLRNTEGLGGLVEDTFGGGGQGRGGGLYRYIMALSAAFDLVDGARKEGRDYLGGRKYYFN